MKDESKNNSGFVKVYTTSRSAGGIYSKSFKGISQYTRPVSSAIRFEHSRLIGIVPMQKFKILVYLIFFLVHIYFYFSESKNTEKQLLDLKL